MMLNLEVPMRDVRILLVVGYNAFRHMLESKIYYSILSWVGP